MYALIVSSTKRFSILSILQPYLRHNAFTFAVQSVRFPCTFRSFPPCHPIVPCVKVSHRFLILLARLLHMLRNALWGILKNAMKTTEVFSMKCRILQSKVPHFFLQTSALFSAHLQCLFLRHLPPLRDIQNLRFPDSKPFRANPPPFSPVSPWHDLFCAELAMAVFESSHGRMASPFTRFAQVPFLMLGGEGFGLWCGRSSFPPRLVNSFRNLRRCF